MRFKHHHSLLTYYFLFVVAFVSAQTHIESQASDLILTNSVNTFMDDWHKLASNADVAYFDKIAKNGIYIGTDATVLWSKDVFVTDNRNARVTVFRGQGEVSP